MTLNILLVVALVAAALWTVTSARLMRAVLGLALTSVILTLIMFQLDAWLAAVFELSVCAGLIPAIFISATGLTRRMGPEELATRRREKLRQYALLPLIVVLVGVGLWLWWPLGIFFPAQVAPAAAGEQDARIVLWNWRHADLIGQVLVLAAAAFGVVVLVKGARRDHGA